MDVAVTSIEIIREVPLTGTEDSLTNRLRRVSLRGFPDIRIYEKADFHVTNWNPEQVRTKLATSQPHLHRAYLLRIGRLADLFAAQGIDIFHLTGAYDYAAYDDKHHSTHWTILPPVTESFAIPQHRLGGFDYTSLLAPRLREVMERNGWQPNPAIERANYARSDDLFHLINDGSHRVQAGLERTGSINILDISGVTPGYPYYAAPQPYSTIQIFDSKDRSEDLKLHVLTAPAHKQLYRLFPSGGILSGTVRPALPGEEIL